MINKTKNEVRNIEPINLIFPQNLILEKKSQDASLIKVNRVAIYFACHTSLASYLLRTYLVLIVQ